MHLLFLSSARPCFATGTAANIVFGLLLKGIADLGHTVSWSIAGRDDAYDVDAEICLRDRGVHFIGDFSDELTEPRFRRPWRTLQTLRKAILSKPEDDLPQFRDAEKVTKALGECRADVMVLFWDTWFENLLPALKMYPSIVYGGRPRYASAVSRLENGLGAAGFLGSLRDAVSLRLLRHQEKRHYERQSHAAERTNICAVDAAIYRRHGLRCAYLPNTWPDAFGTDWQTKRREAEGNYDAIQILGNISSVTATGNRFGLQYLASEVLPLLMRQLRDANWMINITGSGPLGEDLTRSFDCAPVCVKGFVPDLDQEILSNAIFLLLNNAGPYTGGYTRVVYAMASGSCLIAHQKLAESMPEVRHGENALLGETPEEIAAHVALACRDENLRRTLGENARHTYEREYHPRVVSQRLIDLAGVAYAG